jgi:hypothetical protein
MLPARNIEIDHVKNYQIQELFEANTYILFCVGSVVAFLIDGPEEVSFYLKTESNLRNAVSLKKNTYGYDEISTKLLKASSVYISSPLNHLCNKLKIRCNETTF